jgi:hypothetical protein
MAPPPTSTLAAPSPQSSPSPFPSLAALAASPGLPPRAPCAALGLQRELLRPPRQLAGDQAGGGAPWRLQEGGREARPPRSLAPAPLGPPAGAGLSSANTHTRTHIRTHTLGLPPARTHAAPGADQSSSGLSDAWTPEGPDPRAAHAPAPAPAPAPQFLQARGTPPAAAATAPAAPGGASWPAAVAQFSDCPRGSCAAGSVLGLLLVPATRRLSGATSQTGRRAAGTPRCPRVPRWAQGVRTLGLRAASPAAPARFPVRLQGTPEAPPLSKLFCPPTKGDEDG